jgi:hypothetical protein
LAAKVGIGGGLVKFYVSIKFWAFLLKKINRHLPVKKNVAKLKNCLIFMD